MDRSKEIGTKIRKLTKEDIKIIYPYMLEAFPDNERKPQRMIEESFETGFMKGYGVFSEEDDSLITYALFVCLGDVYLFDYLASVPEYRNQGVGAQFLRELRHIMVQDKAECVIGEVENPDCCEDPEEKKLMERRLAFYLRNGVLDTGASGCVYSVEYRFIELDLGRRHTPEEARERIERFYRTYWPEEENYRRYVTMHSLRKRKRAADSLTEQTHLILPRDLNASGYLFGGTMLAWIDELAGIVAMRHAEREVVTVAVDNMYFKEGIRNGDTLFQRGYLTHVGRSSMEVRVDSYLEARDGMRHQINRAYFVMVGVDQEHRPVEVPDLIVESVSEKLEWEAGEKRDELRKRRRQEGF